MREQRTTGRDSGNLYRRADTSNDRMIINKTETLEHRRRCRRRRRSHRYTQSHHHHARAQQHEPHDMMLYIHICALPGLLGRRCFYSARAKRPAAQVSCAREADAARRRRRGGFCARCVRDVCVHARGACSVVHTERNNTPHHHNTQQHDDDDDDEQQANKRPRQRAAHSSRAAQQTATNTLCAGP